MKLIETIQNDMKQAMRNKEKDKLSTLRMLIATIEKKKVEKKLTLMTELTESDIIDAISKNLKTINQEVESLVNAGRDTSKQVAEKELLLTYLPKQMSATEVLEVIAHVISLAENGEIDNIMKYLSQRLKGKVDMKQVSQLVKDAMTK
jgi:uncharacterized protein YqeY